MILDLELAAGNEIISEAENAFSKIDLILYLKFPFSRSYVEEIAGTDVVFYVNRDTHYNVGASYSSKEFRQAIEAPLSAE